MRGWKKDKKTATTTTEAAGGESLRRLAAKRARQDAGRRAKRLVAAWAKATQGWKPEDAMGELESRVARAIRSATERGK